MRALLRRPILLVLVVLLAVGYGLYTRHGLEARGNDLGLAVNSWDVTLIAASNTYFGYFVLIPAWVLICAAEASRAREPLHLVRYGHRRIAVAAYQRRLFHAGLMLVLLAGLAPAFAVAAGLPWGWSWSTYAVRTGYEGTLPAPVNFALSPAWVQVIDLVLRILVLMVIAVLVWVFRALIQSRGVFALVTALLAVTPLVVDWVTAGMLSRAMLAIYFADDPLQLVMRVAGWSIALVGLSVLLRRGVRPSQLPGTRRLVVRGPVLAVLGCLAIAAGAVADKSLNLDGSFQAHVGSALIAGTTVGFSMLDYAVYGFTSIGPAVIFALFISRHVLPRLPYRAIREGSLNRSVRSFLVKVLVWSVGYCVAGAAVVFAIGLLIPGGGSTSASGEPELLRSHWSLWAVQFGLNTVLQIYCYTAAILLAVLCWGAARGVLVGLVALVLLSVPVLRLGNFLPVSGNTGAAFFDPAMPSPWHSLLVLTVWAAICTLALIGLAKRRPEIYLT